MTVVTIMTILRLIPYGVVLFIAIRKGFKWLAMTMVYLFITLGVNYFLNPSAEWRGFLGSIFALFILMHVLDLKSRRGVKA